MMHCCDTCEYSSKWKHAVTRHKKVHTKTKVPYETLPDHQTTCHFCDRLFSTKSNATRHMVSCPHKPVEGQNVTPVGQNVTPKGQNVTPEGQNVTPKGQNVTPKGQNVAHTNGVYIVCVKCKKELSCAKSRKRHEVICKGLVATLQCQKCLLVFATRASKSRHVNNSCSGKINTASTTNNSYNNNQITTNNQTITNSVVISQIINTNNNFTININPLGKENLDHLSKDEIMNIVLTMNDYTGIRKWLQWVHFDDRAKENHNVRFTNGVSNARTKEQLVTMKTRDDKWETTCQTAALKELLKTMTFHITNWLHEQDTIDEFMKKENTDEEAHFRIQEIQKFMIALRYCNPNSIWYVRQAFSAMLSTIDRHLVEVEAFKT